MFSARNIWQRLIQRAAAPVDASSLAVFRMIFGIIGFVGSVRFLAYDWVNRFYVAPQFHFKYFGFEWVEPFGPAAMHAAFAVLAVLSLMVAAGFLYRPAIIAFFLLFTYVELIDVTMYLNHYYLVSLLAFWMCFLPLNRKWSVDALIWPQIQSEVLPALHLWVVRFQVACVYFFAGIAKFGSDWLLDAQPMSLWMSSRVETPIIGAYLGEWWVALGMSWAGFLFDTTIVAWLLWPKTRKYAYVAVLAFHGLTGYFFAIGLFPLIMVGCATIFFDPSWPRFRTKFELPEVSFDSRRLRLGVAGFVLLASVLFAMPWRHLAYPGDVLWTEEGMRWSWKVMIREKNGAVTYRVKLPTRDREIHVPPCDYLTADQEREFSSQPDMILQLGQRIGTDYAQRHGAAQVYVDALVSMNGRKPKLLIDPNVNLMTVSDGIAPADWILDAPVDAPFRPRIVQR